MLMLLSMHYDATCFAVCMLITHTMQAYSSKTRLWKLKFGRNFPVCCTTSGTGSVSLRLKSER